MQELSQSVVNVKLLPTAVSYTGLGACVWYCCVQLYQWWIDGKTSVELTRPWYGKAVGFPFSLYVPLRKQTAAKTLVMSLFGSVCVNDSELEALVIMQFCFFFYQVYFA